MALIQIIDKTNLTQVVQDIVDIVLTKRPELDPDEAICAVEEAVTDVLIYCNLTEDEYPTELNKTVANMTIDNINKLDTLLADEETPTSLTEGDFSISYETKTQRLIALSEMNSITSDYKHKLNKFRKVRR